MARRQLSELCPSTVTNYRTKLRALWKKSLAGTASEADMLEIAELEQLLQVKASDLRGPGRPRKHSQAQAVPAPPR